MNAVHHCRIDPTRNMRRFYRLELGRVGAYGRMVAGRYDNEALATAAMQRQAASGPDPNQLSGF